MKKRIIAHFLIKNDSVEAFKTAAAELISETRKEEGCLYYKLFQEMDNQNEFTFIEEYVNEAAMALHSKSTYLFTFISKIKEMQSGDFIINVI